jgi:hypothetical protein
VLPPQQPRVEQPQRGGVSGLDAGEELRDAVAAEVTQLGADVEGVGEGRGGGVVGGEAREEAG